MDACNHQIGSALFQIHAIGERYLVRFCSRRITASDKNYSVSEKEWLADVFFITCRPYLIQEEFDLYTDYQFLTKTMEPSLGGILLWYILQERAAQSPG